MDTDDLTEMSWDIITRTARVSDTLKAELGALASNFQSEDEWLRGIRAHLEEIIEDPHGYMDYWDLENEEGLTADMIQDCAKELNNRVNAILDTPLSSRGKRNW